MTIGAHYSNQLYIPILGTQSIGILVIDKNTLSLSLNGAISMKDKLTYSSNDDKITVNVSKDIQTMLQTFNTKLVKVYYNKKRDVAYFSVKPPPGLITINIALKRDYFIS